MEVTNFVEVLLPLPVDGYFTYRVPRELNEQIMFGKRVAVQFGKKKIYSGLIVKIHQTAPTEYQAKYILGVLDEAPIVLENQLSLWHWMSKYYLATKGEIMNAALPGALNVSSATKVSFSPDYKGDGSELSDKEFLVFEAIQVKQILTLFEIANIADVKTVYPILRSLQDKGVVILYEELKQQYKPKLISYLKLHQSFSNHQALQDLFNRIEKSEKRTKALTTYIQLSNYFQIGIQPVKKDELKSRADVSSSVLKGMIESSIFVEETLESSRISVYESEKYREFELNDLQKNALSKIENCFETQTVCLLHGITSSGKTEIYIELIKKQLSNQKQVLYLLPEIALTTQLIQRLKDVFGDIVGVFHSKFNLQHRVEVWLDLLKPDGRFKIIVGARSAVFMPFNNLGLVIVDEEHESTFKQFEPSPRYNARDTAIVLATQQNAKVLLGSATPSLESYQNALSNKYGYVHLNKRYKNITPPEIWVADLKDETKKKKMKGIFSSLLLNEIENTLKESKQVILFKNRRGYSPYLQCTACGHTPDCVKCDITLTYHKKSDLLKCHYCGYSVQLPHKCPKCDSIHLKTVGFGTEKIEEELQIYFPDARIGRMDLETTRTRNAYEKIIADFDQGHLNVLIGTQMVSKGLHFKDVALVGILDADNMIAFPDFRAHERAFQLMTQVAGRAGRFNQRGKVIIQTFNPYHFVIQKVIENNFEQLSKVILRERQRFFYPPFSRLIKITVRHKDKQKVDFFADVLEKSLRPVFKDQLIGPEYPNIAWVRTKFNKNLLLKLKNDAGLGKTKIQINHLINKLIAQHKFDVFGVLVDVDPA